MREDDFIERFENLAVPKEDFHHRDHIKLAWLYLQRHSLSEAITRFSEAIKKFAGAHGKHDLYNETITWAYAILINERIARMGGDQSWEYFVEANQDLFDWKTSILKTYYREETLSSDFAKKTFVLPDRIVGQTEKI